MSFRSLLPNAITVANVVSGCFAILWAAEGDLLWSGLFIGVAAVLDFLDGLSARLMNATSEMGKQLDSLSDMVSFGVAPSFIFYYLSFQNGFKWFDLLAFLIVIGSALRLAKFNIDESQKDGFKGLPTPAMAILVASLPYIIEYDGFGVGNVITSDAFIIIFPIVVSLLMVSSIRLFSLKFKDFSFERNQIRYGFLILSVGLLALFQFAGIPMIILTYILLSLIRNFAQ